MITATQKQAARVLMKLHGYKNIRFHADGRVTASDGDARILLANTNGPEFELEYGRYAIIDGNGYESTGYHSEEAAKREAARLSESTGVDHLVVDVLA